MAERTREAPFNRSLGGVVARITIKGTALECIERGSGEPLVFVHGSTSDHRTWQVQQEEFSTGFRTVVYSRRYHWPNERITEGADYSMVEHVEDLKTLLRSIDAVPAHLVGHSYGAFICLLLAIREPLLVRTLVLAEPPVVTLFVSNSPRPLEILRLLMSRPRTALAVLKFGARGVDPATAAVKRGDNEAAIRFIGTAVLGREAYRRLSDARREQVRANFIEQELLGSGFPRLEAPEVRGVRVPTLLVTAQHSPRLFHRLADRLQELLPEVERFRIPRASHIMHEDNPVDYNAAVQSFLQRRCSST
jgi:pimeloyl-ACP methyl ester carboxylesterase